MNLIADHLSRLADFSGRENRRPFWLWILAVYLAQIVVATMGAVVMFSFAGNALGPLMGRDQAYLDAHPEEVLRTITTTIVPLMRNWMIFGAVMAAAIVAMVAAATVRRLHDGGRSGWWAAPVFTLQVAAPLAYAVMLPRFFATISNLPRDASPTDVDAIFASMMPVFLLSWVVGMIGAVLGLVLIVFLLMRGTVGPNRYGADLLPPPQVWNASAATYVPPPTPPPASTQPARIVGTRAAPPPP